MVDIITDELSASYRGAVAQHEVDSLSAHSGGGVM